MESANNGIHSHSVQTSELMRRPKLENDKQDEAITCLVQ